MRFLISSLLSVALAVPAIAADLSFTSTTLKNFQRRQPAPEQLGEVLLAADPAGLSVALTNLSESRTLSPETRALLTAWDESHDTALAWNLTHEVALEEQGRRYWIPLTPALLKRIEALSSGAEITAYVRYLGSAAQQIDAESLDEDPAYPPPIDRDDTPRNALGRVYMLLDIDEDVALVAAPMDTCFANEMLGVALGEPLVDVRPRLRAEFGEPIETLSRDEQRIEVYLVDVERETQLFVFDAGAGYREFVYALQVSGAENVDLAPVENLTLGAAVGVSQSVVGEADRVEMTEGGRERWSYENSPCSLEHENGVLMSIYISEDPNAFTENIESDD